MAKTRIVVLLGLLLLNRSTRRLAFGILSVIFGIPLFRHLILKQIARRLLRR